MRLVSPAGVEIQACDEAVERLIAAGWKEATKAAPKETPKKKTTRKKA